MPDRRPKAAPSGRPRNEVAERRLRALEEPLDVRWVTDEPYPRLEVRNPLHRTQYLVLFPLYPSEAPAFCTCTDFARRGLGTCKHIVAAYRWLGSAEPPAASAPRPAPVEEREALWPEVDRRAAELADADREDVRRVAWPGAVLFERPAKRGAGGTSGPA